MTHPTGSREQWLAARLPLLEAEKELTRRGDEVARQRQELPWVHIDKPYQFETEEGKVSLPGLFQGRSQLMVYHLMFGPDYRRLPVLLIDRRRPECHPGPSRQSRRDAHGHLPRSAAETAGLQEAHGLDVSLGVLIRERF